MAALSERKIAIVRTLVESAPDRIVGRLQEALVESSGDSPLAGVRRLVEAEALDRRLRNMVLRPVAPLCVGDGGGVGRLLFPARAMACTWRGLKALAPDIVAAVETALATEGGEEAAGRACDALTRLAASALRAREHRDFRLAAELCDQARSNGAESLAGCLDLAPILRRAILRLPDWVIHRSGETAAAARLAYKDAVVVADDAGPRFFEMLAAQLSPPWLVLRIISAVMDRPTERYLSDSEAGDFGERVLIEIDEAMVAVSRLDLDAGPPAGRVAGKQVDVCSQQMTELETCIAVSRDHGWGRRIARQRKALASIVEGWLREVDKTIFAALPTEAAGKRRMNRQMPSLTQAPDALAVARATTLLSFTQALRSSVNYAGFSAVYSKVMDGVGTRLDHYVEDVLDHIKTGDVEDVAIAAAHLEAAAVFCDLIRDEQAATLIRRRAAVAFHGEIPTPSQEVVASV